MSKFLEKQGTDDNPKKVWEPETCNDQPSLSGHDIVHPDGSSHSPDSHLVTDEQKRKKLELSALVTLDEL